MIGQIRGTLIGRQAPDILVDVGGIGYEIQVPMTTLYQLPELGQPVTLLTHFVVREDAQQLFGFAEAADRRLFRELIKVSGVGPRLALTLLSGMDAADFARCLQRDDVAALVALPGVGRKTAERLLVEMRDKAGAWLDELSPDADTVSPAFGHATSWPVFRSKWQAMGTLHRRFAGCHNNIRANPYKAQGEEYRNLEYFVTYMSNGLEYNGPAARK